MQLRFRLPYLVDGWLARFDFGACSHAAECAQVAFYPPTPRIDRTEILGGLINEYKAAA